MKSTFPNEIDLEILKALMRISPKGPGLEEIAVSENKIAKTIGTYPLKIRRALPYLMEEGLVDKLSQRGKQRSNLYSLKVKGLFFLFVYGNLKDSKLFDAMNKFYRGIADRGLRKCIRDVIKNDKRFLGLMEQAVVEMKPKINLDFFDENYAQRLFINSIMENLIDELRVKKISSVDHTFKNLMQNTTSGAVAKAMVSSYIDWLQNEKQKIERRLIRLKLVQNQFLT